MSELHKLDVSGENSRRLLEDSISVQIVNPIIGYAKEPLLSLADACAPLTGIADNILTYVTVALENAPKNSVDSLTHNESASIRLYTIKWPDVHGSLSWNLNQALRKANKDDLRPWFKYLKLFLTALTKLPFSLADTVWRGIPINISHELVPGTHLTLWAFSSCTTDLTLLADHAYLDDNGERTPLSIAAVNGKNIRNHSHFQTDDEVILLPGTYVEVKNQFSPAPGLCIVHLQQKIPKEMLLEPPFDGILKIFNDLLLIKIYLYLGACFYPTTSEA